ncbi:dipicolinate synthase subunit B [Ruminococcaceae bacterium OttesenSCG-928-L11]|nr:dipicolinate synthase subunit B [Ruminococcaceae bacterium OttesenSCG-928-L11]
MAEKARGKGETKAIRLGLALCGSFCTFEEMLPIAAKLVAEGYEVTPIMSEFSYETDTRFGKAEHFIMQLESITGNRVLHTIVEVEPFGPKGLLDILVVAPCTGNTLSKMAVGVTDTCVTMAAKAHLRNERPVVVAVSTNDALANSAKNIGSLLNSKHIYFVPMKQDLPHAKPRSVVAEFDRIPEAVRSALEGNQLQPIYS